MLHESAWEPRQQDPKESNPRKGQVRGGWPQEEKHRVIWWADLRSPRVELLAGVLFLVQTGDLCKWKFP